jgi:exodeoxyribonuclease VII small subunit
MTDQPNPQAQPMLDLASDADEGFESLYARLEAVSQQLEAGGLTLEQSLALYEEGMRLAQRCQALLSTVEQRIETLRQGAGGA